MHGTIRLGVWRRFTARQVLRPPAGYIWAATAHVLGLPVTGYDRFSSGTAAMRWRLLGVIPVVTADGADVARSATGRLTAEVVLAPTTFRSVAPERGEVGEQQRSVRCRGEQGTTDHRDGAGCEWSRTST